MSVHQHDNKCFTINMMPAPLSFQPSAAYHLHAFVSLYYHYQRLAFHLHVLEHTSAYTIDRSAQHGMKIESNIKCAVHTNP